MEWSFEIYQLRVSLFILFRRNLSISINFHLGIFFQAEEMTRGDVLSSWEKRSAHIPVIVDPAKIPKHSKPHSPADKENKAAEDANRFDEVGGKLANSK